MYTAVQFLTQAHVVYKVLYCHNIASHLVCSLHMYDTYDRLPKHSTSFSRGVFSATVVLGQKIDKRNLDCGVLLL